MGERLDRWRLERATKLAQKRFQQVQALTERLRMGKGEKRSIIKRLLWGAGYKRVRIIEK
jgi:hypothetical protein